MKVTTEYHLGGKYDVIVCGGGPSGVAAVVSSARNGAKTLLVEQGGCLGGFWTRGLLTWLIDTFDKGALLDEVMERLEKNADGKKFLYHTFISGAVAEQRKVKSILTESKSGHVYFEASVFIDATGDGDPPYQIPLRALISVDLDNLMMAGRCISGDFAAHASYRVGGPAFRTGEVAGSCAAYCAKNEILPKDAVGVMPLP